MKRIFLSIATVLLLAAAVLLFTAYALAASPYVASRDREPFHVTDCKWAKRISPSNAVYYDTREEAINAGHRPCQVCTP